MNHETLMRRYGKTITEVGEMLGSPVEYSRESYQSILVEEYPDEPAFVEWYLNALFSTTGLQIRTFR